MKRFRFSLRTLFVIVTICALILGWRQCAINWIEKRYDLIERNPLVANDFIFAQSAQGSVAPKLPLSLRIWGERLIIREIDLMSDHITSDDAKDIRSAFPEAIIDIRTETQWRNAGRFPWVLRVMDDPQ
jgi:hypothetical protein